jgi:hypothetical protein
MEVECPACHTPQDSCILSFDTQNTYGTHERVYLLQCEKCLQFHLITWEDDWNKDYWYTKGPFTPEEAFIIFLFFMSCREYKNCPCEIHQAVYDWLIPFAKNIPIFNRTDLLEKIMAAEKYPDWQQEWHTITAV